MKVSAALHVLIIAATTAIGTTANATASVAPNRAAASPESSPHIALSTTYTDIAPGYDFPAGEAQLELIRARGDLPAQRAHLWQILAGLTCPTANPEQPVFLTWYGSGEVFVREPGSLQSNASRDPRLAFSIPINPQHAVNASSAPPRITRGHYNAAAYHHVRDYRLFSNEVLAEQVDSIPAFPRSAVVLKTVWWPVPAVGVVALPVWDAAGNPDRGAGNDYPTWPRVVGVSSKTGPQGTTDIEFMGKSFNGAKLVGLSRFFHVNVNQTLAAAMMSDPEARKLTLIALGRPLKAGDSLALVALHVATRELTEWVWGTVWWHDAPDVGPYAALRPTGLPQPWRNYLMNVAFDATLPREPDGTPHIAYNPWLEARLTDSGQGDGVVSNCMSCHERASTAIDQPFTVTRGDAPPSPRAAPVRTSFLWSIPIQAH